MNVFDALVKYTWHLSGQLSLQLLLAAGQSTDVFLLAPDEVRGQRLTRQQKTGQNRQSGHLQRLSIGVPADGDTHTPLDKAFCCSGEFPHWRSLLWVFICNDTISVRQQKCIPLQVKGNISMIHATILNQDPGNFFVGDLLFIWLKEKRGRNKSCFYFWMISFEIILFCNSLWSLLIE